MSQAKTITQLHDLDTQLQRIHARLQEIDDILNNDEAVQAARTAITATENRLKPLRTESKDLELEIDTVAEKLEEAETTLYGGTVTNTKVLQDIQQEIASLKTRQESLEEKMLGMMEDIDEAETILKTQNEHLENTLRSKQHQNEALVAEQGTRQAEITQLKEKRDQVRTAIDAATLQLYDRLHPRFKDTLVARMKSDATCGRCGVQQTRTNETEIRRGNIVQCTNCQRILVF
jgi:predicted  nucleic acid-binding Zn-ribbon protein